MAEQSSQPDGSPVINYDHPPKPWSGRPDDKVCSYCHRLQRNLSQTFRTCTKCKVQPYCSRYCQVEHWKRHQNKCEAERRAAESMISDFLLALGGPDDLSEDVCFRHLIDCHRRRIENSHQIRSEMRGLYDEDNHMEEFKKFLDLVEGRPGVLPSWWSAQKRSACEKRASYIKCGCGDLAERNYGVELPW